MNSESESKATPKKRLTVSGIIIRLMMIAGFLFFVGWLLMPPLITPGWVARIRTQKHRLRGVAWAIQDQQGKSDILPVSNVKNASGDVAHGWMTQLLPYLDNAPDTDGIDFESPWNHKTNRPIFSTDVDDFQSVQPDIVRKNKDGYSLAHIAGNEHVIRSDQPFSINDITDGTSNTILLGEVYGNFEPWGKPGNVRDPMKGINTSPHGFGTSLTRPVGYFEETERLDRCLMFLVDGQVRNFSSGIDPDVLRKLALPNDGEDVGKF